MRNNSRSSAISRNGTSAPYRDAFAIEPDEEARQRFPRWLRLFGKPPSAIRAASCSTGMPNVVSIACGRVPDARQRGTGRVASRFYLEMLVTIADKDNKTEPIPPFVSRRVPVHSRDFHRHHGCESAR